MPKSLKLRDLCGVLAILLWSRVDEVVRRKLGVAEVVPSEITPHLLTDRSVGRNHVPFFLTVDIIIPFDFSIANDATVFVRFVVNTPLLALDRARSMSAPQSAPLTGLRRKR